MPNLLVIGGGLGGCAAVVGLRKFDKDTEIIMVEPKDHCELYWAAYRSPFEPWVADGSLLSLTEWVETYNVKHVRSTVTKISKTSATLANGDSVDYDVVVVATGADSPVPFLGRGLPRDDGTKASRLLSLKEHGAKMLSANSIAVVGGGLVGTELAGDIGAYARMQGKDIAVTVRLLEGFVYLEFAYSNQSNAKLIHSGPYLSHTDLSAKASKMVQGKLEKIGVKVILGERVNETDGRFILAKSGESLDADQVIMTTGITPVNCFLKNTFPEALNAEGWIETDDYFRVKGTAGKLFSIGDCSTFLPNSGAQVMDAIKTIRFNISQTIGAVAKCESAPSDARLKRGKVSPKVTLSTVGPNDGVFETPVFYTQWLFPRLKNSTMFFFRVKGELGLKT